MQCTRLPPVAESALPAPAQSEEAARVQLQERTFWMQRDLAQTANNRTLCEQKAELAGLIEANNEAAR